LVIIIVILALIVIIGSIVIVVITAITPLDKVSSLRAVRFRLSHLRVPCHSAAPRSPVPKLLTFPVLEPRSKGLSLLSLIIFLLCCEIF